MHTIVVGGGVMGLSTAWALARQGHRVSVYESNVIPNERGSSFDQHRAIRYAYGKEEGYAGLIEAAFAAWRRLERDAGLTLYERTGVLALDRDGGTWARDSARVLERIGVQHRLVGVEEVARGYPLLATDGVEAALAMDQGGILAATRILRALRDLLSAAGVALHEGVTVRDVDPEAGEVACDNGRERADAVVIAAGPWVPGLLPQVAGRVMPSRQVVVYVEPDRDLRAAWAGMPTVIDVTEEGGVYFIPPVGGLDMKIGDHTFSLEGDPDREREPTHQELSDLFAALAMRVREYDRYALKGGRTCFYTVSADEHFIVEPVGARSWVMTGFSGHGFKFGALMGELMADALSGQRSPEEVRTLAAGA